MSDLTSPAKGESERWNMDKCRVNRRSWRHERIWNGSQKKFRRILSCARRNFDKKWRVTNYSYTREIVEKIQILYPKSPEIKDFSLGKSWKSTIWKRICANDKLSEFNGKWQKTQSVGFIIATRQGTCERQRQDQRPTDSTSIGRMSVQFCRCGVNANKSA